MDMPDNHHPSCSITLSVPPAEQWTLHHVLLDRIEREATAVEPTTVDPPPVEIFQAFETLDAGDTTFTIPQLDAMQTLLAEYHHATTWVLDRPQIEELLHRITTCLDQYPTALLAD